MQFGSQENHWVQHGFISTHLFTWRIGKTVLPTPQPTSNTRVEEQQPGYSLLLWYEFVSFSGASVDAAPWSTCCFSTVLSSTGSDAAAPIEQSAVLGSTLVQCESTFLEVSDSTVLRHSLCSLLQSCSSDSGTTCLVRFSTPVSPQPFEASSGNSVNSQLRSLKNRFWCME